jgi:threonine dehydratase
MNNNSTPIFRFPEESPFANIILKREDESPYGSHKFRYLESLLKNLKDQGQTRVVLSTTGNAGITASLIGKKMEIQVICLMSDKGRMNKAAQIENAGGLLILTPRPIRFAKYIAKKYSVPMIRMSSDGQAAEAYESLGNEIIEQVPDADAVVNFATSGTSSLGIMKAYEASSNALPALHLVQSGKSCSIVRELHPEQIDQIELENSVGLSDTPHREALLEWINKSHGDAHYISQEYRKKRAVSQILADHDIQTSWEGESAFAAAMKITAEHKQIVVILSGKQWPEGEVETPHFTKTFEDIDAFWSEFIL